MQVEDLLKEGKLQEALEQAKEQVRSAPADAKHRTLLFQLMAIDGQWDRALTQLNVASELDAMALIMGQMYTHAIQAEVFRAEVFAGKRSPLVLGEPPEWIGPLFESLRLLGIGERAASDELRDQAFETAPATPGKINDEPFEWFADADPRFGPVVEAIIAGKYYWIPVERIKRIEIEAPSDLRDLVWMPAHFVWSNDGDAVGLIPTRYPGSESADEDVIKLSRKTVWQDQGNELFTGLGQRLLATDAGEFPLLDTRTIEFECPAEDAAEDSA